VTPICFITGPEGSGTSALVRALASHPHVAKGDAGRFGSPILRGEAAAQLIPLAHMSSRWPGVIDLDHPDRARRQLSAGAASLLATQPSARAIFFKYSTPALRPAVWPVFLPLFEVDEFRVIVIWRQPLDAIYSAYRRFHRGRRASPAGYLAACRTYAGSRRHLQRQLAKSPRDRCLDVGYESLVRRTEPTLRAILAFANLEYRPAEVLLPGRGFSDENGKWKRALRRAAGVGRVSG
jgi:Sulfotransferase family